MNSGKIDWHSAPRGPMPLHVQPMLTTVVSQPFSDPNWLFEIKWDGYRTIAEIKSGEVLLYSRHELAFNDRFAPIVQSLTGFKPDAVLDGEVVVLDQNGRPQFQLLQHYQNTGEGELVYYVFDLLYLDGHNLQDLPLQQRKEILRSILPKIPGIDYGEHVRGDGIEFFASARQEGLEGIVAKKVDSPYRQGQRTGDWLKIKLRHRQEAVIGGFTAPRGSRQKFGALVLGIPENDRLRYIGHTGSGFSEATLAAVFDQLEPLIQQNSPFLSEVETNAPVTWVKPKLVCEVEYAEWTKEGFLRQPVFLGLREDKLPAEVMVETPAKTSQTFGLEPPERSSEKAVELQIGAQMLKLKHLDKVFWPEKGYTKRDLIDYYRYVAPLLLPHLKDRPESLLRYPDGISGEGFFQKEVGEVVPDWISTVGIRTGSEKKTIHYLLCQDEATLIYLINHGSIDLHPWSSRVGSLDNPDFAVIDLDPEEADFSLVIQTAQTVREVLESIGIAGYCKTTGGRGMHIYLPLGAKYSYEQARQFTQLLCLRVNEVLPEITSLERSPSRRRGLVYLDYLQNARGQTLASVYSVRPKPGAFVSTPLRWDEVNKRLHPSNFTLKNTIKRLDKVGDLFKPVLSESINLVQALDQLDSQ